jgi:hypothetical protein
LVCRPIITPALEEKLVEYPLLIEWKYFGCTPDDIWVEKYLKKSF